MRSRQFKLAVIWFIVANLFVAYPSYAETSRAEQIQSLQAEIEQLNQQISNNQMLSFNLTRNLEENDRRQQERRAQAETESDNQRRQLLLDAITGWDIWAVDARAELFGYNYAIQNAEKRISLLQEAITKLQAAAVEEIVQSTNNNNAGNDNTSGNVGSSPLPISALELQNTVLQGQVTVDQNKTQQQIFSLNAVNTAIQALKPGSETWYALVNTKTMLERALQQTSENLERNKELLEMQTKLIEDLKSLNLEKQNSGTNVVKETLENVINLDLQLTGKIEQSERQIAGIDESIRELESALQDLNKEDPNYAQVEASRDLALVTREKLVDSSIPLKELQKEQEKVSREAKNNTIMMRIVAVITGIKDSDKPGNPSNPLAFERTKSGLLTAKIDLTPEVNKAFTVTSAEIEGLSLTIRGPKVSYRVKVKNFGNEALVFTLPKRIPSGRYELNIKLPGKKIVSVPTRIIIK